MSAQPAAPPLVPFERVAIAQPDRGKRVKQRDYLAEKLRAVMPLTPVTMSVTWVWAPLATSSR